MSRTVHDSLSVRGYLHNAPSLRRFRDQMRANHGRRLSPGMARDVLLEELAKGNETIPCDALCANPCPRAGCPGFNYSKGGGCGGHPMVSE